MYSGYYKYHLRGLGVVGVKFWASPLTFVVALTTLSHYRDGSSLACHVSTCSTLVTLLLVNAEFLSSIYHMHIRAPYL